MDDLCREKFEIWFMGNISLNVHKTYDGNYTSAKTANHWISWQAAWNAKGEDHDKLD